MRSRLASGVSGGRCRRGGRDRQLIEGQARGRRVFGEGAGPVQAAHFHRGHAFAHGRFQRGFPARFDVQLLPQALQAGQLVLGQPGFQRALLLHVFLQLDQGGQAGLQARQALHFGLRVALGAAALGVGLGHAGFQLGQLALGFLELVLACRAVAGQLFQARRIRTMQLAQFLL